MGPDVTQHKVGDRVFVGTALSFDLTGCYAEKVKRKASEVLPVCTENPIREREGIA